MAEPFNGYSRKEVLDLIKGHFGSYRFHDANSVWAGGKLWAIPQGTTHHSAVPSYGRNGHLMSDDAEWSVGPKGGRYRMSGGRKVYDYDRYNRAGGVD